MGLIRRPRANPFPRIVALPVAIGVLLALVFGGVVLAQGTTFTGCLDPKGTLYRVAIGTDPVTPCKMGDQQVSWNEEGPAGPPGSGGATVATLEIGPGGGCLVDTDYHTSGVCPGSGTVGGEFTTAFEVDPADYPAGAVATFWTVMFVNAHDTLCARLFDLATQAAVPNSEICVVNSTDANQISRANAAPIGLQADSMWVLQVKNAAGFPMGSGSVFRAQLVIDWE